MPDHSENEDRITLLRLKNYEKPEEGFARDFLEKFHERQRSEMLRRSSLSLLRDRVAQWYDDSGLKRALIPAGLAAAAAGLTTMFLVSPQPEPETQTAWSPPASEISGKIVPVSEFIPPTSLLPPSPWDHLTTVEPVRPEEQALKYRLIPPPMFDEAEQPAPYSLR